VEACHRQADVHPHRHCRVWPCEVHLDPTFFDLPRIRLLEIPHELPAAVPHLGADGGLCYLAKGTVVLDIYDPVGQSLACLQRAAGVFGQILKGEMIEDLAEEFFAYWHGGLCFVDMQGEDLGRQNCIPVRADAVWPQSHCSISMDGESGIIHEIEMAVRAEKSNDRSNRIVKQLEAMKKNWAVRLEKLSADQKKDDLLSWELLGIDALFVDEAHLHKNLYRFTKMTRVAGLPLTSSERASLRLVPEDALHDATPWACAAWGGVFDGDTGGQHHGRESGRAQQHHCGRDRPGLGPYPQGALRARRRGCADFPLREKLPLPTAGSTW
jgi:hypothetical protein